MGEKVKKGVVLVLALLTALAFTPFLFGTPDTTPQQQVEVQKNSTDNSTTSTESVTQ